MELLGTKASSGQVAAVLALLLVRLVRHLFGWFLPSCVASISLLQPIAQTYLEFFYEICVNDLS